MMIVVQAMNLNPCVDIPDDLVDRMKIVHVMMNLVMKMVNLMKLMMMMMMILAFVKNPLMVYHHAEKPVKRVLLAQLEEQN